MPNGVIVRLRDALDRIESISSQIEGRSLAEARNDRMFQLGLERQLSQLGSVLGTVLKRDQTLVENLPLVPIVVEMGDTIIRDYYTLDYNAIWTMTVRDLPLLAEQIEGIMATYFESPLTVERHGGPIPMVDARRSKLIELCQKFEVAKLMVFGSAVKGTFDPARSDLDFAVEFTDYRPGIGRRFMGFIVALEDLFPEFPVHISSIHEGSSDHFRNELQASAITVYEREGTAAVA